MNSAAKRLKTDGSILPLILEHNYVLLEKMSVKHPQITAKASTSHVSVVCIELTEAYRITLTIDSPIIQSVMSERSYMRNRISDRINHSPEMCTEGEDTDVIMCVHLLLMTQEVSREFYSHCNELHEVNIYIVVCLFSQL